MKNNDTLRHINELAAAGKLDEALACAEELVAAAPEEAAAVFARGKLLWRMGERHRAMADYARAAELDPEGPASMALEQAREIDSFYCRDLYNP